MSRDTRETEQQESQTQAPTELVPAMFASSRREAERCVEVLRASALGAVVGENARGARGSGVPVLVPESQLDAAAEILSAMDEEEVEDGASAAHGDEEEEEFDDDEMDDELDDEEYDADDEFWDDEDDDEVDDEDDE
ncbi:MAG: hypothetical protein U1A27_07990 [Phycisphaerae bacterium]